MMRGKPSSASQKTYDECYLLSSTAIYFEAQGKEAEALSKWRECLDQIYYHNAYRMPAGYVPKTETEKSVKDSLRHMERVCKERIDILEALRDSRDLSDHERQNLIWKGLDQTTRTKGKAKDSQARHALDQPPENTEKGFIGNGTIPALSQEELPKPALPARPSMSSAPLRPSLGSKNSSEYAVVGRRSADSYAPSSLKLGESSTSIPTTSASAGMLVPPTKQTSRSPSPEKGRRMLQTLRTSDRNGKKPISKSTLRANKKENPITNMAASLAWGNLKNARTSDPELDNCSTKHSKSERKRSLDDTRAASVGAVRYDHKTRTMVPDTGAHSSARNSPVELLTEKDDLYAGSSRSNRHPFPVTDPSQPGSVAGSILTPSTVQDLIDIDSPAAPTHKSKGSHDKKPPPPPPPKSKKPAKLEPLSYPSYMKEYPETAAKKLQAEQDLPIRSRESDGAEGLSKISRKPVPDVSFSYVPASRTQREKDEAREARKRTGSDVSSGSNNDNPNHFRANYQNDRKVEKDRSRQAQRMDEKKRNSDVSSGSIDDNTNLSSMSFNPKAGDRARRAQRRRDGATSSRDDVNAGFNEAPKSRPKQPKVKQKEKEILADLTPPSDDSEEHASDPTKSAWAQKVAHLMKNLPRGTDEAAAKQIFNEIVVQGDEVHWDDVAGLDAAKNALKEAVVYPFLRPDLFMGLREPARGMLLFGPPGTGKTMLARAVATESKSTFFSISASSLTSKYLGESEKLVRALFSIAKALAPSIIFVDEIDSLLSSRSGSGEHEATRRIKTEFLIQWSDLQRAAAGSEKGSKEGDASRVLVLAATNLPWAIDEAARRRFVRRQYIPLPEDETRAVQLRTLLGHQKHSLSETDIGKLIGLTDGFSGSDITALAKDAAMGPLRSLGEALLHMSMDQIRPIQLEDFEASLKNIRPSVSKEGLKEFEDWARQFGERGG